jgi:hypothetical protein
MTDESFDDASARRETLSPPPKNRFLNRMTDASALESPETMVV